MPNPALRLRVVAAAAGVVVLPLLALAGPGTTDANAAPPGPPSASPSPTCVPKPLCFPTTPPPSPTAVATTPAATPTHSATPKPSPSRTHHASPKAKSTYSVPSGTTASPVTGTVDLNRLTPGTDTPTTDPTQQAVGATSSAASSNHLALYVELVLGGALLLGLGGLVGLYLTRHPHEH